MKDLTSVTRVVARIEPYMVGINSEPDDLREYARVLKELGVEYATWDTYSYSANNVNIAQRFEKKGYNFTLVYLCHYFVLLNIASAHAFIKFILRRKQVVWTPRKG